MWKKQFVAFAHYNQKMNEKLYLCAGKLSAEEREKDCGAFFGSLQNTLQHIMVADIVWLRRFMNIPGMKEVLTPLSSYPSIQGLRSSLYPDFNSMFEARKTLDELIIRFVDATHDGLYDVSIKYKNMAGEDHENFFWLLLTHFFNHQTHHRGQATTLFSQQGVDVGVTDFPLIK